MLAFASWVLNHTAKVNLVVTLVLFRKPVVPDNICHHIFVHFAEHARFFIILHRVDHGFLRQRQDRALNCCAAATTLLIISLWQARRAIAILGDACSCIVLSGALGVWLRNGVKSFKILITTGRPILPSCFLGHHTARPVTRTFRVVVPGSSHPGVLHERLVVWLEKLDRLPLREVMHLVCEAGQTLLGGRRLPILVGDLYVCCVVVVGSWVLKLAIHGQSLTIQ